MAGYKRYKKDMLVSYSLGTTLTFELLKYKPECVRKVYIHSQMKEGDTLDKLRVMCQNEGCEMIYGDKIFNILSKKENCFCIGEFSKYEEKLIGSKNHVVLVNPSNSGNLGTILRSALGFDMNNIAIIRPAADIFDPKVIRASMGAVFSTHFQYFDTFEEYRETFADRAFYPFMLDAEKELKDLQVEGKFSLIFGNEAAGLPEKFRNIGTPVIISHSNRIDSLNLPIAASIAMYETS